MPEQFYDERSFHLHLAQRHGGAIDDLKSFSAACMDDAAPLLMSCPLCSWTEMQADGEHPTAIIEHIAEHVHSFSLRSLPWATATKEVHTELENAKAEKYMIDWLSGIPSQRDKHQLDQETIASKRSSEERSPKDLMAELCKLLNIGHSTCAQLGDPDDDYFRFNGYFGENADDSVMASGQTGSSYENESFGSSSHTELRSVWLAFKYGRRWLIKASVKIRPPFDPDVPMDPPSSPSMSSVSSSQSQTYNMHWVRKVFERRPPNTPLSSSGKRYVVLLIPQAARLLSCIADHEYNYRSITRDPITLEAHPW